MKIISNFKDYYDHVAYMYGGGDPKIVYNRVPLTTDYVEIPNLMLFPYLTKIFRNKKQVIQYNYKYLVINARYYLLVGEQREEGFTPPSEFFVLNKVRFPELYETLTKGYSRRGLIEPFFLGNNMFFDKLVDLSRILNSPVFTIADVDLKGVKLDRKVPKLAEHGIPTLIPPEMMYQEISYFMGNLINKSADLRPPIEIEDKFKIEQAGFDIKTSFRHPVK